MGNASKGWIRSGARGGLGCGIALFACVALGALVPERSRADCCACLGCVPSACVPFDNSIDCTQYCQDNGGCPGFHFFNASCNPTSGECEANTPTATATATATATQTGTATATPTNTPAPNGGGCVSTSDCVAGNFCVDGACCNAPSCAAGSSCGNPGQVGMCSADPAAPAPALSPRSLMAALAVLVALGGLAMLRRRRL